MKKNKITIIIIAIMGLLMLGATVFFLTSDKEEKQEPPKKVSETNETDIINKLPDKIMDYVAETKGYTKEKYNIGAELKIDTIVVKVETKEGQLVETLNISLETLKKWQPKK